MANHNKTLWKLDPHTRAKHVILRKYLAAWLPIITKHKNRVVFIDGFAGPGEYENGEPGSPVIAINTLLEHKISIDSEVIFLFVESDKERCDFLKNILEGLKLPTNIRYEAVCGDFAGEIGVRLEELEKKGAGLAPTFAFIDPFGFKGAKFEVIMRIMKNKSCEILINFMYEDITRWMSLKQNEANLDEFYGCKNWRDAKAAKNPEDKLKILHGLYKSQLKKLAKYVVSFKMVNNFH